MHRDGGDRGGLGRLNPLFSAADRLRTLTVPSVRTARTSAGWSLVSLVHWTMFADLLSVADTPPAPASANGRDRVSYWYVASRRLGQAKVIVPRV